MSVMIHPTALIEEGVRIGAGSSIWDNVHIRRSASIGEECIIGEKSYIAYDVKIGNRVKINAFVYICAAVTIEDGVMISAGTIFTNDRFPRATTSDLKRLRSSAPDEHTLPTLVREGATIGAGRRSAMTSSSDVLPWWVWGRWSPRAFRTSIWLLGIRRNRWESSAAADFPSSASRRYRLIWNRKCDAVPAACAMNSGIARSWKLSPRW